MFVLGLGTAYGKLLLLVDLLRPGEADLSVSSSSNDSRSEEKGFPSKLGWLVKRLY